MRELKATDKITQKMTRDGAVSENLATGEVEHISSREPETELSASSEESAGAAADLALRAAEHHEKKSTRKAEKADTQAVRDGSAARQHPSSRLQFTEEEHADPALIYEDDVSGKLSDDRFAKMSRRYADEQKEISEKIKTLRAEMDKLSSKSVTADMFISTVRKYTRAKTLTPRMLNELIDHIEVHQAEKIDGIWEQHLVIHYNCVGAIFIPDVFPLPAPQMSVNTRKGVVVNYAPGQLAV